MEATQWTDIVTAVATSVAASAAVMTFIVVALGVLVAWGQLGIVKAERKSRLVAELADRWDGPLLSESREKAASHSSPDDLRDAVEESYKEASAEYYALIRVPSFFDSLGSMTRQGSITEDNVRQSLSEVIKTTWIHWLPAVRYLRSTSETDAVYDNFEWLYGKM